MELKSILLSEIDSNPQNSDIFSIKDIEHLASIIKEEGFTSPIEVFKKKDGRYEITAGHRRYEAMKLLKEKEIPCYVSKETDETLKNKRLLSSNIATRKLSPLEIAKAIQLYKELLRKEGFKGNTRNKVAEYFNISASNVYRYECLLNLIPELQEFCKNPSFQYSSLREAATLSKEEQKILYNEILQLEATEKGADFDEIDINEIYFTRTRIEQLINHKIRKKEQEEHKKEKDETDFPMPEPIDPEDDSDDISSLIINDEDSDEVIDLDEELSKEEEDIETYLKGFNTCITTIKAYKSISYKVSEKERLKEKINELRKELDKLEQNL